MTALYSTNYCPIFCNYIAKIMTLASTRGLLQAVFMYGIHKHDEITRVTTTTRLFQERKKLQVVLLYKHI